jgi:hypothetical protein
MKRDIELKHSYMLRDDGRREFSYEVEAWFEVTPAENATGGYCSMSFGPESGGLSSSFHGCG